MIETTPPDDLARAVLREWLNPRPAYVSASTVKSPEKPKPVLDGWTVVNTATSFDDTSPLMVWTGTIPLVPWDSVSDAVADEHERIARTPVPPHPAASR